MDKKLPKYPFLEKTKKYVEESDITIEDLVKDPAFNLARARAKKRVLGAINDARIPEIQENLEKKQIYLKELYSYPLSRIIVSCIDDSYLIKRYSLAEAKSFHEKLKSEKKETFLEISTGIGLNSVHFEGKKYRLHFSDYLKLTDYLKEKKWKLVNQEIVNGFVCLNETKFRRVLQEGIRKKIEQNLPVKVPREVCEYLEDELNEIKTELEEKKSSFTTEIKGTVKEDLFPPCISNLINQIKSNVNLSHPARFAVVSFLINIGMEIDEIIELFEVSPDFDEERTRYQIEHIGGEISDNKYIPPACSTLKTYGLCIEGDWRCEKVSHPLGYYEWRIKSNKKDKEENETKN